MPKPMPGARSTPAISWWRLLPVTLTLVALAGGNLRAAQPPSQTRIAAAPSTAPQSLKNFLAQVDAAASRRDVNAVLQFYSQDFKHADGFTRQTYARTLSEFWKPYKTLTYRTQLKKWQAAGKGYTAETVTEITGTQQAQRGALKATVTTRQQIVGQKIIRQEVLAERSQLTSGTAPPTVELNLPQQVKAGQDYNFDAIVKEPLGESLLLGAALEEPVSPQRYLGQAEAVKLTALPAGGIFRVGKAPTQPANRWISAVLVREGGTTIVSQRLQVVTQRVSR